MSTPTASAAEMVTALVRLREALANVALPLDVPEADTHRTTRHDDDLPLQRNGHAW